MSNQKNKETKDSADNQEELIEKVPEQIQVRKEKRAQMLENGVSPYPVHVNITSTINEVRAKYEKLQPGDETNDFVGIAGRVIFVRNAGRLCFAMLQAGDGTKLQAMFSEQNIGKQELKDFKKFVDLGDHLYVYGKIISSKTGELSVFADKWEIASKSIRPLPVMHKDLNEETRIRRRYADLIVNQNTRDLVRIRSKIIKSIRQFFDEHEYIELETPMLQTIHGGAAARPFVTHMNAFDIDLYLRIAPELFLKRAVVGGIDRVFEINRNFRNEGVDSSHSPEFAMLEAYQAYGDYEQMANMVEEMIKKVCKDTFGTLEVTLCDGTKYDYSKPFNRISLFDSLNEALKNSNIDKDLQEITPDTDLEYLRKLAGKSNLESDAYKDDSMTAGKLIEILWEHYVGDELYEPTFVFDFPSETSPLTRPHRSKKGIAEKWDFYIRGIETATAYSELVDPVIQRDYLVSQSKLASQGDEEAMQFDEDFIEALEYGMPPSGGLGMGIDRLIMAFTGYGIRETITFPLVKPIKE